MYLYLVQHGKALSEDIDPSRSLSDEGIEDVKKVASLVSSFRIQVSEICHSGKMRALQTAQIIAEAIGFTRDLKQVDGLAPMDDPEIWYKRISETDQDLMLVGHLPHLSRLTKMLICKDSEADPVIFEMGGVVCLAKEDNSSWQIHWIVKPWMVIR